MACYFVCVVSWCWCCICEIEGDYRDLLGGCGGIWWIGREETQMRDV